MLYETTSIRENQQMSQPLPREYRVTGTAPVVIATPTTPKKTEAALPFLDTAQSFWLLLGLHAILIAGEVYIAWRAGWLKW